MTVPRAILTAHDIDKLNRDILSLAPDAFIFANHEGIITLESLG